MPLYMLMYPFLVIASYYAISQNLHLASPNEAFFAAAIRLLPGWLLGLVAAGASLSGLLVLTGICLAIGPIVTRNLLPKMPENRQKASAKVVIVIYLLISIVMTLLTPNLMLTLINTAYYGVTQFFPGVIDHSVFASGQTGRCCNGYSDRADPCDHPLHPSCRSVRLQSGALLPRR